MAEEVFGDGLAWWADVEAVPLAPGVPFELEALLAPAPEPGAPAGAAEPGAAEAAGGRPTPAGAAEAGAAGPGAAEAGAAE